VGGGSLVYGNTLYRPLKQFYTDPQWSDITNWESELAPYYDQASRMLGVVDNPHDHPVRQGHTVRRRRFGGDQHFPPDTHRSAFWQTEPEIA
jgi:cholesterol oxidase